MPPELQQYNIPQVLLQLHRLCLRPDAKQLLMAIKIGDMTGLELLTKIGSGAVKLNHALDESIKIKNIIAQHEG